MAKYNEEVCRSIFDSHFNRGKSITDISKDMGIPRSSVHSILISGSNRYKFKDEFIYEQSAGEVEHVEEVIDPDEEIIEENVRLAKKVQRLQDSNRISNKSFREFARADNMIISLQEKMVSLLKDKSLSGLTNVHGVFEDSAVGVIQLSDLHFNELISDLSGNNFDMSIASKRVQKHIKRCTDYFLSVGVNSVALFLTGDLMNSDRRISEITEAATNRTNALFIAVDILQQAILELNEYFNVVVASVTGNESRIKEFIDYTDFLASDSYDVAIHNMLSWLFRDSDAVRVLPITNPLEAVVDVNGCNFLLVHGHAHRGLSRTSNIEVEVEKIKARYAARGVTIHYVICGHIHQAYVSDLFSRSGGLPGANTYSERALNLNSRASQNGYIVWPNKSIDGFKVDLQNVENYEGYSFDLDLQSYNSDCGSGGTVIIQSVLV